jgi:hypothetical protein
VTNIIAIGLIKAAYMKMKKIGVYVLIISLAVFIISLTQTALTYNDFDGQKTYSSISLLFMGGLAILGGGLLEWFIWLANPLYFLALIFFFKSKEISKKISIVATCLALTFATWKEILTAENGRTSTIETLNCGYWLWTLSLAILTIGIFYYFRQFNSIND